MRLRKNLHGAPLCEGQLFRPGFSASGSQYGVNIINALRLRNVTA
jgi:hypothetical protein